MKSKMRYLAIIAMLACAWAFLSMHRERPTPLPIPLDIFPQALGEWRQVKDVHFDQRTLNMLNPVDYMAKRYSRQDGEVVDIYVGYHDGASQTGGPHSPRNCLPGSGWYEVSTLRSTLPVQGKDIDVVIAVYQFASVSELFIYWFQVNGEAISSEYLMKLHEIANSIRNNRRDIAFIRISVPMSGSMEQALSSGMDFLKQAYPALQRHLPS